MLQPHHASQTQVAHALQVYGSAKLGRAGDSVVTLAATWELFQTHDAIANLTVNISPGWPTAADTAIQFEDICYRNQLEACAFSGCAMLHCSLQTCLHTQMLQSRCRHVVITYRCGGTAASLPRSMLQVPAVLEFQLCWVPHIG